MSLSIEKLSQPVSEDAPSGENLQYDPAFTELVNLFQFVPQKSPLDEGAPVREPDWRNIGRLADQLRENTRDLRIQVYATLAALNSKGLTEFRDNLELIKILLDEFWDSVHPQLDPEDDNDLTERTNTLEMLNDHSDVVMALEAAQLVEARGIGSFSMHDIEVARGNEAPKDPESVPDIKLVQEAFNQSEAESVAEKRSAVTQAVELLDDINKVWKEKSGESEGLTLDETRQTLDRIFKILEEFSPSADESAAPGEAAAPTGDAPAPGVSGVIRSRTDVVRVLDRICEYYAAQEPSSPVPLLLRRAQRLVEKSFMEILEDMVPDGVNQARMVSGEKDEG